MSDRHAPRLSPNEAIAALVELIDALDRRVPHVERAGERRIAEDAAGLRSQAVARLEALKRGIADREGAATELANETMTDDGDPTGS